MLRVLPREAAEIIGETFAFVKEPRGSGAVRIDSVIRLGTVVAVIDGVPEELLPTGVDRTRLATALGAMRSAISRWSSGGHEGLSPALDPIAAIGGHPLTVAYSILSSLPDEAPSQTELELAFITDPGIRRSIRTDMSNADRAIGNAEWKAASVLAGSVVEALLLWAITEAGSARIAEAAASWKSEQPGDYKNRVERSVPEQWHLSEHVEIAFHLEEITDPTRKAVRLAADYRNLIHPGRVLRVGAESTHGSALVAVGAMREVARELSARHA